MKIFFYATGVNLQPQLTVCTNCHAVRCNAQCYPYPTWFWGCFCSVVCFFPFCLGRRRGKSKTHFSSIQQFGETDLPGTEDFNVFNFNTERILKKEEEGISHNVTGSWRLKPSLRQHRKSGAPAWISHLAAWSKLAQ